MNDTDKELLVKLISNGTNTYADLRKALPHIHDTEWKYLGVPSMCAPNTDVARLKEKPFLDDAAHHEMTDTDIFELTVYGENLLYRLNKENRLLEVAENSLQEAHQSSIYARRAYYATVIIGLISISIAILAIVPALISS